jgi:hypothetical protein
MKVPNGLKEIIAMYGQPCTGLGLRRVAFPAPIGVMKGTAVHPAIYDSVNAALKEIFDGGHWGKFHDFGGCYNCRSIRGKADRYSTHSWAIALDFNTVNNALGVDAPAQFDAARPFVFTHDHPIVEAFTKQGALWGGFYKGRKDCMHFQFATGY